MEKDAVRELCLALPGATEEIQWGYDLLYKVGGKMFVVMNLEPAELTHLSLRCTPEDFAEYTERDGIVPNKYLKRHHWISITDPSAVKARELGDLIRGSYGIVHAKLTKKLQAEIAAKR